MPNSLAGLPFGWGAVFALLNLILGGGVFASWVRSRPKMREIERSAEEKLRDDLIARVEKLENRLEETRTHYESKLEKLVADYEAAQRMARHELNNVKMRFRALVMLLKRLPNPAPRICIEDGCTTAISKTSKGRCKPCALNRLRNDPAIKARRAVGIAAHHARPEVKEANRARMADFMVNMPEAERERRREHGRRMVATKLHTPESQAKALAARSVPEVKARRSLSMARTLMPWLPSHLVQAYRDLTRSGLSPAEARTVPARTRRAATPSTPRS